MARVRKIWGRCERCGMHLGLFNDRVHHIIGGKKILLCRQCEGKINIQLKENHLKEIKTLIKETRQLNKAKEKIQKWKKEGYDVSELEKLLEEVK